MGNLPKSKHQESTFKEVQIFQKFLKIASAEIKRGTMQWFSKTQTERTKYFLNDPPSKSYSPFHLQRNKWQQPACLVHWPSLLPMLERIFSTSKTNTIPHPFHFPMSIMKVSLSSHSWNNLVNKDCKLHVPSRVSNHSSMLFPLLNFCYGWGKPKKGDTKKSIWTRSFYLPVASLHLLVGMLHIRN